MTIKIVLCTQEMATSQSHSDVVTHQRLSKSFSSFSYLCILFVLLYLAVQRFLPKSECISLVEGSASVFFGVTCEHADQVERVKISK